ncbi:MAG: zinc-ribbon domain-containing protein [Bacteroidota bacterium]
MSKYNLDFFRQLAFKKNGKCVSEEYNSKTEQLIFECQEEHRWIAYVSNILKGHWCRKCGAKHANDWKKDSIDIFQKIAHEKGGECYSDYYENQNTRLTLECSKGHVWSMKAAKVKRGYWCKVCALEIRRSKRYLQILEDVRAIAKTKKGRLISNDYKTPTSKLLWECSEKHQWRSTANNIRLGHWCRKCALKKATEHLKKDMNDCKRLAILNEGHCLSSKYINSQANLTWKCKYGHIWQASYANVKKGTWCRICSRKVTAQKRRTPFEYFIEYSKSRGGLCLSTDHINQKTRLEFQCEKGHVWSVSAGSIRANKTWCPKCAGTYKADTPELQAERLNVIKQIAKNNEGECLSDDYINQKIKLQFKCKEGHVWWTVPSVIKSGAWCKRCASKKANDWKRDNIRIFKKLAEARGGKCLTATYENSTTTRLLIECEKGHQWLAFPGHLKKGLWCRKCNGSFKHELADVIRLAGSRGGECLSSEYKNDMSKIKWKCAENHVWEATPNNIKRGKWCPTCNSGIGERVCRLSFEKIFKTHFNKVRPDWLRNSGGYIMELDGYNEDLKLAFEHQGSQHYGLKSQHWFDKQNLQQNDKEKTEICSQRGITIIYIPEVFTLTKLANLLSFILEQLKQKGISYPVGAENISLNPKEVYTYTKTKEVAIREQRALKILEKNEILINDIYRWDQGVKVKMTCKKGHVLTARIGSILNGVICSKCNSS